LTVPLLWMLPFRSITLNCCQGGLIRSNAPSLICHENASFEDISSMWVVRINDFTISICDGF
jgi:hypothetical protein